MNELMDWTIVRNYHPLIEDDVQFELRRRQYRLDHSEHLTDLCHCCGKPLKKQVWKKPALRKRKLSAIYFTFRFCQGCGKVIR